MMVFGVTQAIRDGHGENRSEQKPAIRLKRGHFCRHDLFDITAVRAPQEAELSGLPFVAGLNVRNERHGWRTTCLLEQSF